MPDRHITGPPTSCPQCQTTPVARYGEQVCRGCGRPLIICSDGACWPLTGMGAQSAAWHERRVSGPPRRRPRLRHRRLLDLRLPSGRQLTVYPGQITVTELSVHEDGTIGSWYPLRVTLLAPRIRLKRGSPFIDRHGPVIARADLSVLSAEQG